MSESDVAVIEREVRARPAEWADLSLRTSSFWDDAERTLRVYFPVRDALLSHGRGVVEANAAGELPHAQLDDYRVLGRRATDDVHGVDANVVRDGLVLLASPVAPVYNRDNVRVYDFGTRDAHHDHQEKRDGKVSCYKNHGNKICSFLPGVRQNRCAMPSRSSKSCVDYNGWPVSLPYDRVNSPLTPSTRTARGRARRASLAATARSRLRRASAGMRLCRGRNVFYVDVMWGFWALQVAVARN